MSTKLLKDLDFAVIVSEAKASTESGREMVKNYAGYLFSNPANYTVVNNFVREARQFSYDKGIMEALEKVVKFISENKTSWNLASACESVASSRPAYDALSKNAINQVSKLLENLNEAQLVQYIKAGAMKNVQYIPEFRSICKGVYSESVMEAQTSTYTLTAPVTFAESLDDVTYFSVAGRTYKTENGTVMESEAPSQNFTRVNSILTNMNKVEEGLEYTYNERGLKFIVAEGKITIENLKSGAKEEITEAAKFDEWRDIACRGMYNQAMKINFMHVTEAIACVFNNIDSICESDSARILRSSNGTVMAIVEGRKNVIVNTLASRFGTSYKSYDTIVEALKDIEKISNVNLQTVFENRISEEVKQASDDEINEAMKELLEQQIAARRKRIEQLTEQYKTNPVKLAILNKLAKEVSKL